jgi:hypothetical protein
MAFRGGSTELHDDEAEDVVWLPFEEAVARLTHPNERRLVRAADPQAVADTVDEQTAATRTVPE